MTLPLVTRRGLEEALSARTVHGWDSCDAFVLVGAMMRVLRRSPSCLYVCCWSRWLIVSGARVQGRLRRRGVRGVDLLLQDIDRWRSPSITDQHQYHPYCPSLASGWHMCADCQTLPRESIRTAVPPRPARDRYTYGS